MSLFKFITIIIMFGLLKKQEPRILSLEYDVRKIINKAWFQENIKRFSIKYNVWDYMASLYDIDWCHLWFPYWIKDFRESVESQIVRLHWLKNKTKVLVSKKKKPLAKKKR